MMDMTQEELAERPVPAAPAVPAAPEQPPEADKPAAPADRNDGLRAHLAARLDHLRTIGPAYALPRLAPLRAPPPAPAKTVAWWGQQKKWPPALMAAIAKDQPTDKTFEESEIMELAHLAHAPKHTIRWWALHRRLPAWLAEAMAVQHFANRELTEDELLQLAVDTAGLPLGRKGSA